MRAVVPVFGYVFLLPVLWVVDLVVLDIFGRRTVRRPLVGRVPCHSGLSRVRGVMFLGPFAVSFLSVLSRLEV